MIPASVLARLADLDLSLRQAEEVSQMLIDVEKATRDEQGIALTEALDKLQALRLAAARQADQRRERTGEDWKVLRLAVFERDSYRCQYCQSSVRNDPQCDHVIPLIRGGKSKMSNLVTACKSCNSSKKGLLVSEWKGPAKNGAQRQAAYRARRNGKVTDRNETVTKVTTSDAEVTKRNAPWFPPKEYQNPPPVTPHSEPTVLRSSVRTKCAPHGCRLPEDWQPSEKHRLEAEKLGVLTARFAEIVEEFRNYWLSEAGQKARKMNWDLTFLNRLRDQAKRDKQHKGNGNGQHKQSLGDAARELAEQFRRERMQPGNGGAHGGPPLRLLPGL